MYTQSHTVVLYCHIECYFLLSLFFLFFFFVALLCVGLRVFVCNTVLRMGFVHLYGCKSEIERPHNERVSKMLSYKWRSLRPTGTKSATQKQTHTDAHLNAQWNERM